MAEQRLIDANAEATWASENLPEPHSSVVVQFLRDSGTIGPETLSIVRQLREQLERVTAERDEARRDCTIAESNHSECLVQLAEARVQLKSAITDMEAIMWHSGDGCNICKHCVEVHREPYVRLDCGLGGGCECRPEWRGAQKEE